MKLYHLIFIVVLGLLFGCNQNKRTLDSKEKIVSVLKARALEENRAFYKKDSTAWNNCFLHSPSVYWVCVEDDVTLRANGWEDLKQFVASWMKDNPIPENDSIINKSTIEDFNVELDNEIAFVKYKKNQIMPDGLKKTILESRVFKLDKAEWKIVGLVSVPSYSTFKSSKNIFVHNDTK
jgi:hypothetical protein